MLGSRFVLLAICFVASWAALAKAQGECIEWCNDCNYSCQPCPDYPELECCSEACSRYCCEYEESPSPSPSPPPPPPPSPPDDDDDEEEENETPNILRQWEAGLRSIPEATLPPPPPYDPELSPQVQVQVGAALPGDIDCDEVSSSILENLAVNYCLNILKVGGLDDAFFANQCTASCGSLRGRRLLRVNPVLFDIDFVRANEDPAAVEDANGDALNLEAILLDDDLLEAALEETLPGSTVTGEEVSTSLAGASPGTVAVVEEGRPSTESEPGTPDPGFVAAEGGDCTDIPTPDEYTCEQQKGWGKCTADFMLEGGFCAKTCGRC